MRLAAWKRRSALVLVLLALAVGRATAQDNLTVNAIYLGSAPCAFTTGSGAPSGGNTCDHYLDTSSGDVWTKLSGGWVKLLEPFAAHNLLVGQGATTYPNALGGCTNGVLRWASSSVDPICDTNPEVTSIETNGGTAQDSSYASQTTGWQITAAGAADFRYLFANELRILLFTAEQEAVLAGALRVTKSYSTVSQTFTCPALGGTATLWVADSKTFANAAIFVSGDSVVMHALTRTALGGFTVSDCVGVVTSYTDGTGGNDGQQSWTFTRGTSTAGGSMTASTTVAVNQLVQDFGVTGNGYVELIADDGSNNVNAPYMQIATWSAAPIAANITTRVRIGQLTGVTSVNEYGLLAGSFFSNAYIRLTDQNAEIKGLPLSLLDGGTVTVKLDPTVPSIALGNPLPSALMTGTGVWMGKSGSAYGFRAGNPSGDYVEWDGSHLSLHSTNLTINSSGGVVMTPNGNTATYGYQFTSPNQMGLFGNYVATTVHQIGLWSISPTGTPATVSLSAIYNSGGATDLVLVNHDGTLANSTGQIDAGTFTFNGNVETSTAGGYGYFGIGVTPTLPLTAEITLAGNYEGAFVNGSTTGYGIYVAAGNTSSQFAQVWYNYNLSVVLGTADATGVWAKPVSSTWAILSDAKTKKNIVPLTGALARVRQLQLHEYDYTGEYSNPAVHGVGVVAEEVQPLFPRAVTTVQRQRVPDVKDASGNVVTPGTAPEPVLQVDFHELFVNGLGAIIELDSAVQALTARVAALEKKTGGTQ